jgi:hypothetical protein
MAGKATELVVSQHVLIYSWLLYQYARQVETRFILHDTEAKEVPIFTPTTTPRWPAAPRWPRPTGWSTRSWSKENLAATTTSTFSRHRRRRLGHRRQETVPELKKMLAYANRVGITIAEHGQRPGTTPKWKIPEKIGPAGKISQAAALDVMEEDADEPR